MASVAYESVIHDWTNKSFGSMDKTAFVIEEKVKTQNRQKGISLLGNICLGYEMVFHY